MLLIEIGIENILHMQDHRRHEESEEETNERLILSGN